VSPLLKSGRSTEKASRFLPPFPAGRGRHTVTAPPLSPSIVHMRKLQSPGLNSCFPPFSWHKKVVFIFFPFSPARDETVKRSVAFAGSTFFPLLAGDGQADRNPVWVTPLWPQPEGGEPASSFVRLDVKHPLSSFFEADIDGCVFPSGLGTKVGSIRGPFRNLRRPCGGKGWPPAGLTLGDKTKKGLFSFFYAEERRKGFGLAYSFPLLFAGRRPARLFPPSDSVVLGGTLPLPKSSSGR